MLAAGELNEPPIERAPAIFAFPPANTFPLKPAPPVTTKAPVVVEVD